MKKLFASLLLISLFLLASCKQTPSYKRPLTFFYPKKDISYDSSDGYLSGITFDGGNLSDSEIISRYLQGTTHSDLSTPFPHGTYLVHFETGDRTARITLSDSYASLSGIDLSIANACLVETILTLTDARSITIRCETQALDGSDQITFFENDILLIDTSRQAAPTESITTNPTE